MGYVPSQRWEYEKTEGAITEPEYIHHPSYYPEFRAESWSPYNSSSVFYDDISGYIKKKIDEHNRLVLILQGLFDRSACLHPHPQFQLWTEKGFTDAIQLVYDDSRTHSPTEKPPDWEAYRARCNASLDVGSVTVGQDDAWMRVEAERENKHREQFSHRYSNRDGELRPLTLHRPHGNPGPGMLAKVAGMTRAGACKYEWEREREVNYRIPSYRRKEGPINCHLTVEQSKLFNVSAYQPGDFRQFFNDPRTRSQYLKWACALLEAEEFHAGNRKLGTPGKDDDE